MAVRYVGKPSQYKGKVLFDILCNLKDFGKGRVVVRNVNRLRYPTEACFFRIVRAEPEMDPDNLYGVVWADSVFRGVPEGIIRITSTEIKDFQLLSKEEEAGYCKNVKTDEPIRILPAVGKLPPLLKELVLRDREAQGLQTDQDPELPLVYRDTPNQWYRQAAPGEQPTVQIQERIAPKIHLDTVIIDPVKSKAVQNKT